MMRFVWFWTFWHWSTESFQDGSLLRSPLHRIGSHWDEWFSHEASPSDLRAIEEAGRTESTQRQFIAWLFRRWWRGTAWRQHRMVPRFVLAQLAQVPPFQQWQAFTPYRADYGVGGIRAVVLGAESPGRAQDVRPVEAIALPADGASTIVPEGFQPGAGELDTARRAAKTLCGGKGLLLFLASWVARGHRPYPRWVRMAEMLAWLAVGGLILCLLIGPEPGERLFLGTATLLALWSGLIVAAVLVTGWQCVGAWREGTAWRRRLEQSQVRIRMNGGLRLKGESAGLAFGLNTVAAIGRTEFGGRRSWLWRRFLREFRARSASWAATGVLSADGRVKPVVLEAKLRACLEHACIKHILVPKQPDSGARAILRLATPLGAGARAPAPPAPLAGPSAVGFAAENPSLRSHSCRHLAQSVMAVGNFSSRWQIGVHTVAVVVSALVIAALPVRPPPRVFCIWKLPPRSPAPKAVCITNGFPSPAAVVRKHPICPRRCSSLPTAPPAIASRSRSGAKASSSAKARLTSGSTSSKPSSPPRRKFRRT